MAKNRRSQGKPPRASKLDADKKTELLAGRTVYQFKITLLDTEPPIWRRIQVADCTLDNFHLHIQSAMGWENCHLHQFEINGKQYADPDLWDVEFELVDSTKTNLSQVLPATGKRFVFHYEYDFGDGWKHEIRFEGRFKKEPGQKYPLCLEGARACPPEDIGGIHRFYWFLDVLSQPSHEQHDDFIDLVGEFDAEHFDAGQATRAMR